MTTQKTIHHRSASMPTNITSYSLLLTPLTLARFSIHSPRRSSQAGGGGGVELHGPQGDVALSGAGQTARTDPWLPGALRPRGERRVPRPAVYQRCHAGRRPGKPDHHLLTTLHLSAQSVEQGIH